MQNTVNGAVVVNSETTAWRNDQSAKDYMMQRHQMNNNTDQLKFLFEVSEPTISSTVA